MCNARTNQPLAFTNLYPHLKKIDCTINELCRSVPMALQASVITAAQCHCGQAYKRRNQNVCLGIILATMGTLT